MDIQQLKALREELDKRLYYAVEEDKMAYQKEADMFWAPVQDWSHASQSDISAYFKNMDKLRNITMSNIRKSLDEDEGFFPLLNALPAVEEEKKNKETELEELIQQRSNRSNSISQKIVDKLRLRIIIGDDKQLSGLHTQISDIRADITFLGDIIKDINDLTPIYNDSSTSGGKRKSHRNRKNKKSRQSKSRKILKRAYARSENTKKNKKNKKK